MLRGGWCGSGGSFGKEWVGDGKVAFLVDVMAACKAWKSIADTQSLSAPVMRQLAVEDGGLAVDLAPKEFRRRDAARRATRRADVLGGRPSRVGAPLSPLALLLLLP